MSAPTAGPLLVVLFLSASSSASPVFVLVSAPAQAMQPQGVMVSPVPGSTSCPFSPVGCWRISPLYRRRAPFSAFSRVLYCVVRYKASPLRSVMRQPRFALVTRSPLCSWRLKVSSRSQACPF